MSFKKSEITTLLVQCHRRCCLCHKFCGTKIEIHHIKHKSEGGNDTIENAIPLCFECHAEVALYNPSHPKGRKFTAQELKEHKIQWLDLCRESPQILVNATRNKEIGPLEGMILEMDFNLNVIKGADGAHPEKRIGCALKNTQHEKAMSEGALILLSDDVKQKINDAYLAIGKVNAYNASYISTRPEGNAFAEATQRLYTSLRESNEIVASALTSLIQFLAIHEE